MKKDNYLLIRLSDDEKIRLKSKSAEQKTTMSKIIRKMIADNVK